MQCCYCNPLPTAVLFSTVPPRLMMMCNEPDRIKIFIMSVGSHKRITNHFKDDIKFCHSAVRFADHLFKITAGKVNK